MPGCGKPALILILGASIVAQGQQGNGQVASIQSLIRSQQYDQALQMTQSALHDAPSDARLWTLEGIIFSIRGSDHEALNAFDRALKLSPADRAALRGEVQIFYRTQDKRAIPLLERILRADPKDETANELLAILEAKQGKCGVAIEHFLLSAQAISTHPESLQAYGYCLEQAGQTQKAIAVFEQLVALVPGSTYPKYDLAVLLVNTKQAEAALKVLEPLLKTAQTDSDVLSLASEAYEATGDTPKAVSLLRQAIVLSPANAGYYVSFAALCLDHESYQVGIDMIDAGLQRVSGDPSMFISRGLLYAQLADYDKAEADFNTAEKFDSAHSLGSYAMDLAELQRNHPDKALLEVRSQLKAHPDNPLLYNLLAQLLTRQDADKTAKTSGEAIRAAQEAVKLKPDLVEARDLLASIYIRSGQYNLAIQQCRLALHYAPSDRAAIYHLILALRHSPASGEGDEIQTLIRRLSDLQQAARQQETKRAGFKLVEQPAPAPMQ
jgi:tetratricopeptide (TPR) repeat protein